MNIDIRKSRLGLVLAAGTVLVISLLGAHVVPLYDGVGFPDEPYRYVSPPTAGLKTPSAPSDATASVRMSSGANIDDASLTTTEQGPQALAYVSERSITTPSTFAQLTLRIEPRAPGLKDQPADGQIAGNIYRLSVDNVTAVSFYDKSDSSIIDLRLPQANAGGARPGIEYRANGSNTWSRLETLQAGNDIYQTPVAGFGDYAMVMLKPIVGGIATVQPKHRTFVLPIVLGSIIGAIALIIIGIRLVDGKKRKHVSNK